MTKRPNQSLETGDDWSQGAHPRFDDSFLLDEPARGTRLIREFYEQYSEPRNYKGRGGQHEKIKAEFFQKCLDANHHDATSLGLDVGCRGGALIELVGRIRWFGVDINSEALQVARASGIPCVEMDFTAGISVRDETFDALMMTEVLEHLPYPSITVREVHRILKKKPGSVFLGSVPLDYHLHRRWKYSAANGSRASKPMSITSPSRSWIDSSDFTLSRSITFPSAAPPSATPGSSYPLIFLCAISHGRHPPRRQMSAGGM